MAKKPESRPEQANPGQFQKGRSGNPGGRPKVVASVRALAQAYTAEAIEGLIKLTRSRKTPAAAKVAAFREILDRGNGKSMQAVELSGPDGAPLASTQIVKALSDEEIETLRKIEAGARGRLAEPSERG